MTVRTYSISDHSCNFAGIELNHFAEGDDVITISQQGENTTWKVGAGGDVVIQHHKAPVCLVTIKVLGTSQVNAALTAILATGLAGGAPICIRDTRGLDVFICPVAWLQKHPDDSRGASASTLSWVFVCPDFVWVHGGTAS